MANVVGFLRDNATFGENQTCKLLQQNLPKEFTVYVETPIRIKRELRYPDFVVLTNYGVIVLEVKDWVTIEEVNPHNVLVRTRQGQKMKHPNPVGVARDMALALSTELSEKRYHGGPGEAIPWSYAVILINQPISTITQLRAAWGEDYVLGRDDLSNPDLLLNRLKMTFPVRHMRNLTREELTMVRATIYPVIEIAPAGREKFVLDEQQERLVAEPVKVKPETPVQKTAPVSQSGLFDQATASGAETQPAELSFDEQLVQNISVRLVRGVAGSGKTLVLTQRAKYLAAKYPEWNLAIVSYNDELVSNLKSGLHGTPNVKPITFHKLCSDLMQHEWRSPGNPDGWIEAHRQDFVELCELPAHFLAQEITWIKEVGISSREEYLATERLGRGRQQRITRELRERIYDLLQAYDAYLANQDFPDWADVPNIILKKISAGQIQPKPYDVVLVDEAQDFAPAWIQLIKSLVKPEDGLIFLADDPTQSIYRYFSWKQKGIPVVGRTVRLRVPYRNTYEIYQLAYEIVRDDPVLQQAMSEEGVMVDADVHAEMMRHGPRPLMRKHASFDDQVLSLQGSIRGLLQKGCDLRQIAVLHRRKKGVARLQSALAGLDVNINTFHAYKGLEFDHVFLADIQDVFQDLSDDQEISEERRLLYMAITRARQQLTMTYQGVLPKQLRDLGRFADMI